MLEGDDITGLKAHELVARGVGYVPQINNVFPSLTVEENLEMGGYLRTGDVQRAPRPRSPTLFPRLGERHRAAGRVAVRAASARCWRWAGR